MRMRVCRPLRPNASQSVRFPFIALHPGVHAISTLCLTDVETQYSINMRYVCTGYYFPGAQLCSGQSWILWCMKLPRLSDDSVQLTSS